MKQQRKQLEQVPYALTTVHQNEFNLGKILWYDIEHFNIYDLNLMQKLK